MQSAAQRRLYGEQLQEALGHVIHFVPLKCSFIPEGCYGLARRAAAVYRRQGMEWSNMPVTAYHVLPGMTSECRFSGAMRPDFLSCSLKKYH